MEYQDKAAIGRSSLRRLPVEALIFLGLLVVYGYFIQPPGANALSRYDLVLAVAEQGTTKIDAYHMNTGDKGYFDGHYYSDKPIGVALLSLPIYVGLRALFDSLGHWPLNDQFVVYVLNLFVVATPTALLSVLIYRLVGRFGRPGAPALLAALAYGLGTMALPFATLYFGHQTAAFFGFAVFYALLKATEGRHAGWWSLLAGALAGLAVITEYPLIFIAGLLGLYALLRLGDWRNGLLYALGGVPFVVILGLYNYVSFGSPFSVSYEHVFLEEFAGMHEGMFGITMPNGWVLLDLLFSGKGLLTNSPVLALAPLGALLLWGTKRWRAEVLLFVAIVGTFLVYNSAYFLPFGGWTPGPRFLTPMLPFAAVLIGIACGRWRAVDSLGWGLLAVSATVMFLATVTSPLVGDHPPVPFFERWLPAAMAGEYTLNHGILRLGLYGAASLLPLAALVSLILLAGVLEGVRPRPRAWARLSYAVPLVATLAVLWLAPLPGLTLGGAVDVSSNDPVVVVQSVRALPPTADGQQVVEVIVSSVSSMAPNIGLSLEAEDANGRLRTNRFIWPINLVAGKPERFTLTWQDDPSGEQDVRWVKVRVLHWSLSYLLAEVRAPVFFFAKQNDAEERIGGFRTIN